MTAAPASAAPDECDQFDRVALAQHVLGVLAFGDEVPVDLGGAGLAFEAQISDQRREGGPLGQIARLGVHGQSHRQGYAAAGLCVLAERAGAS